LGTLVLNQSFTGTVNSSSGALSFLTDGVAYVGTSDPEIVTITAAVNLTGPTTINIGRLGTTLLPEFTTASNKTVSLPGLTLNGNDLTVNNLNGYGLLIPGASRPWVSFEGPPGSAAGGATGQSESFSVIAASTSNAIPGLTISGQLSNATGVTSVAMNKLGVGTMVLTNTGNTFTGPINIEQGSWARRMGRAGQYEPIRSISRAARSLPGHDRRL
jgi:autotransporter-associated beta strand protein